jgi:4-carboxymuconolactone decarboxylase
MIEKSKNVKTGLNKSEIVNDHLPGVYKDFLKRYPKIGTAYDLLANDCHEGGPLDKKTRHLVKLGIAIGLNSEGAVRSHARRALQDGASPEELRHVVLLTFTTAGFSTMIAAYKWVEEVVAKME